MPSPTDLILHALDLARAGDRQQSAAILHDVLRGDPSQVQAWKLLAFVSPNDEEALFAARRALQLDPADVRVLDRLRVLQPEPEPAAPERRKVPMSALILIIVLLLGTLATISRLIVDEVRAVTLPQAVAALDIVEETPGTTVIDDFSVPVRVNTSTNYYSFEAESVNQIRYAMATYGPEPCCGYEGHPIALTAYQLGMSWKLESWPDRCDLVDAEVVLDIVYTYPQWMAVGNPPPDLYDDWHEFMIHVTEHEEHHGAIAYGCATRLAERVAGIETDASCAKVDAELSQLLDETNRECESLQLAFDDAEGVTTFPLP